MPLRGKGMLAVFCETEKRHEADLNEWYNREHIAERIAVRGMHRARRYVAIDATPKYLATYECGKVGDLASPAYLRLLARGTPWTRRVTSRFTSFTRLTLTIEIDLTVGIGGVICCVRFLPAAAQRAKLLQALRERLPAAIRKPGMLGAAVGINDLAVATAPSHTPGSGAAKPHQADWLLMLEATDEAAARAAARSLFSGATLKTFAIGKRPAIGTYRLLFGDER